MRPDVGEGDPRRLLHHVAELTGERQPAGLPVHRRGLHEQHVAAGSGDGQAGGHAGDGGAGGRLLEDLLTPQRVANQLEVDDDRRLRGA